MADEPARAHGRVHGRVQGVSYRVSARARARALGLRGWVRNLSDGSVELMVEGPRARVQALIDWCHDGPPRARVQSVDISWHAHAGDLDEFKVVR